MCSGKVLPVSSLTILNIEDETVDHQPSEAEKDDIRAATSDGNCSTTLEMASAQAVGVLPGIGSYSDSSNSDSSSSDSEIDTDMFRRSSKDVEKIIQTAAYQH